VVKYIKLKKNVIEIRVFKLSEIIKIIISNSFFDNTSIYGVKQLDCLDWCSVAKLMSEEKHLTIESLNLIREIKLNMNKGRK